MRYIPFDSFFYVEVWKCGSSIRKKATASSRSAVEVYRMTLSLKTPNASALKSKLHAILIYFFRDEGANGK